jgi:predicted Rossmann fold nucleotide-binding protein DprA/Smf involved in DNA uptake
VSSPSPGLLLGGSRSLSPSAAPLVRRVVSAALRAGFVLSSGCAAGADQIVISSALALAPSSAHGCRSLRVAAAGSSAGAGFWSGSAPLSLLRSAAAAGAQVSWLAGGSLQVPLRARLLRRSLAALAGCSSAAFFLASPTSPGSLRVAAAAVASGAQVFAFPYGFEGPPAPPPGCAGSWLPGALVGCACWQWRPEASQPALF